MKKGMERITGFALLKCFLVLTSLGLALNARATEGGITNHVWATGGFVVSSPAIGSDGTIYVGSYDNKLYALNPDGTTQRVWTTGAPVFSSPAIFD